MLLGPPSCEAPGTASFLPLLPAHGGQGWAVGSAGAWGGCGGGREEGDTLCPAGFLPEEQRTYPSEQGGIPSGAWLVS